MSRVGLIAFVAGCALASSAAAQFNSETGRPNDPSTYAGSVNNEAQMHAAQQQQNQPQQPQYQAPTTRYNAPSGSSGSNTYTAPPSIDWSKRPLLPAARNPLLGRWHPTGAEQVKSETGGGFLDALVDTFANWFVQGTCDELFGDGVLEFRATTLVSIHPDGREVIKNHVQYHADGRDVVVVPQEAGSIDAVSFTFNGKDKVTAEPGCPMVRVGGTNLASVAGVAKAPGVGAASAKAAAATLKVQAGRSIPGNVYPLAGVAFYLVTQDPDAALAKTGFTGPSPIQAWFQSCRTDATRCRAGVVAMTANPVATGRTDAAGAIVLPPVAPGRYYVVGHTPFDGKEMVWRRQIDLNPGENGLFFDQTNGTAG